MTVFSSIRQKRRMYKNRVDYHKRLILKDMKKAFKKTIELKKIPKMNIIDSDILNKYKEYNVILDRINKGLNKYHSEMLCSKCHLSQQTYALKLHKKYRACYICINCAYNVRSFKARCCNKCYYPKLVQLGTKIVTQSGLKNRCHACRKYCMGIGQTNKTDFFKMDFRCGNHYYNIENWWKRIYDGNSDNKSDRNDEIDSESNIESDYYHQNYYTEIRKCCKELCHPNEYENGELVSTSSESYFDSDEDAKEKFIKTQYSHKKNKNNLYKSLYSRILFLVSSSSSSSSSDSDRISVSDSD